MQSLAQLFTFIVMISAVTGQNIGDTEYVFEWDEVDYDWRSEEERQTAIDTGAYIPSNNIIAGVKLYNDVVLVTVPRWLPGVPSTMNKVIKKDDKDILQPFPSWEKQESGNHGTYFFYSKAVPRDLLNSTNV